MRLTLITPGFAADAADDCIPAVRALAAELARRHRVDVLALRYPTAAREYELDGVRVTALGGDRSFGVRRALLLARAGRWLRRRARSGGIDLVHALWADEPGWLAVALDERLGVPALVSLLGGELARLPAIGYGHQLHRVPRWLVSRTLRRTRALTVGSPWLGERLEDWRRRSNGAGGSPARLAPLGVDSSRFRPGSAPDGDRLEPRGAPNLLSVGSLTPVKAQATMLRALAAAARELPDARLHLVGEGPERAPLEALAAALGIAARVHFHGALPHVALPALYRSADLCLLTSLWESQSMVALEAAACGRATLGSAVGLLPELEPSEALVAPGDAAALGERLARFGAEPERWRRWGEQARARALPRFELARAVADFERAYAEAIAARRAT